MHPIHKVMDLSNASHLRRLRVEPEKLLRATGGYSVHAYR
jgi:hypothetical protein